MYRNDATRSEFARAVVYALRLVTAATMSSVAAVDVNAAGAGATVAIAGSIVPSPLLSIDQNRTTVVDHVIAAWGDALVGSGAGLTKDQLQALLTGLRSDQLLAASLAGSLEGLRNVIANALIANAPVASGLIHTKALGDATDDLVYTPVTPCREVDTRNAGGPLASFSSRNFKVWVSSGGFAAQGGAGTNCNIPANPAAVVVNIAAVSPAGAGNFIAYPTGTPTSTSVLNYQLGQLALSNGAIVPACQPNCVNQLTIATNGAGADVVIDIVGYFKAPGGATGLDILANGQRVMRYEYNAISPNVIGGSPANNVTAGIRGATIAGGGVPVGSEPVFFLGAPNRVYDHYGTVGGGYANVAGKENVDLTDAAVATVAGGANNVASAFASSVGGGASNIASQGGATVGGGESNHATAFGSTVSGGASNTASGDYSVVAGGQGNTTAGTVSFAAGQFANANFGGCFVWGDTSTTNEVRCDAANRFVVRSLGGIYMFTGGTTNMNFTGVSLLPGASAWNVTSDRASKDHFAAVDARDVLRNVAAMPIATWNWKSQDASIRHMGPMAQDFRAAFGLGETEKGISTVDADGVALAAIQGLNAKVDDQLSEISTLKLELAELRRVVDVLMARIPSDVRVSDAH